MASAVIGALRVDLDLGVGGWKKGLSDADRAASGLSNKLKSIGAGVTKAGVVMSAGITAPFVALMSKAIPAAAESAAALGQVQAALKSMGNGAGRSVEQLQAQAGALETLSTFDDDDILRKVTANMLTFGNVAGEQFDRAQKAAVDLSARMGGDLQSSALMLGKALNDPAKGLAALRRVGIQFTQSQQDQIKAMAAAGDAAGAQKIMLSELERQFGGSAKALRAASPGADVAQQWRTFQEVVGKVATDILPRVTSLLAGFLEKFNNLPPGIQTMAVAVAAIGAGLGPVMMGLGPLISLFGAAIPALVTFASSLVMVDGAFIGLEATLGVVLLPLAAIAAAAGAAYLVWKNWDTIAPMLQAFGAAVVEALGPAVMGMVNALKDAMIALWNSDLVNSIKSMATQLVEFGGIVLKALGPSLMSVLGGVVDFLKGLFGVVENGVRLVVAVLSGDWAGAWTAAKGMVSAFVSGVGGLLSGLAKAAIGFVARMVTGVDEWVGGKLSAVWEKVRAGIDKVKGFFHGLWDAVVGHSYIPDMVDGIGQHIARLDALLVKPTKDATSKATEAFRKMSEDTRALLDRLFPEWGKMQSLKSDLALIDKSGLSPAQKAEARKRRGQEEIDATDKFVGFDGTAVISTQDLLPEHAEFEGELKTELLEPAKRVTADIAKGFAEMGQNVLGSLRGMVDSFKGGDILGGLQGLLDIVLTVVDAVKQIKGLGGPKVSAGAAGPTPSGGRAMGGPVSPGYAYRVGERGPEWFVPGGKGRIEAGGGGGGGNVYHITGNVLTEEMWAQIAAMDDHAAARGAMGGVTMMQERSQRAAQGRLGGGRGR